MVGPSKVGPTFNFSSPFNIHAEIQAPAPTTMPPAANLLNREAMARSSLYKCKLLGRLFTESQNYFH